jgi:hypothetical protein
MDTANDSYTNPHEHHALVIQILCGHRIEECTFGSHTYEYYCGYDQSLREYIVCGSDLREGASSTIRFTYNDCEDALFLLDVLLEDVCGDVYISLYDCPDLFTTKNTVDFYKMNAETQMEGSIMIKNVHGPYDDRLYNRMRKFANLLQITK